MQALTEFAPLLAFFVAYYLRGLYVATAVLMVAMLLLLAVDWLRTRRIPPMHALSTVLVVIFGSATLLLHNKLFIQWKPTVFFWLTSLAFLGSFWIGERTLTERLLGTAFGDKLRVPSARWRTLNAWWVGFYAFLGRAERGGGAVCQREGWVALKVVDGVLMVAFVVAQVCGCRRAKSRSREPHERRRAAQR